MEIRKTTYSLLMLLYILNVSAQNNSKFVNTFIGTDGTGHTFPGPSLPFGMVQPGPDNNVAGWNHTSGYQYKDTLLLGFSQTRFSGTGIGEMGNILLLPFNEKKLKLKNSYFKNTEKASVGYYTLTKKDDIKVELTCSEKVSFHKYTYPHQKAKLLLDFQHGFQFLNDSLVLESDIHIENNSTISGYCKTKGWVTKKYFFTLNFETPFIASNELPKVKKQNAPKYILDFQLPKNRILQLKIALSTVSVAGAKQNLKSEIPHWSFEKVRQNAEKVWNDYLNRIDIEAPQKQKEIFYTSLYHLLLQPSNIADVDGKYRGADDKINTAPNKEYYSTLSIWDVYRAAFPLLQIIAPEKIDGIVNTMLLHHKAAGFLPIWTAWGQDNYCMIGNHAIPMILSAHNNGFDGFDTKEALKAMLETSTKSHINSNWELYNQYGYYPFDKLDNEAVSRTLESGYDDWCVAQMASFLNDEKTATIFSKRANYYKNLFDPETKLFRGKDTNGNWRTPFDPLTATSPMNNPGDYTEANAWQYFWTPAQYDIDGMKNLLGGSTAFTKKLNDFFTIESLNPNKFLGQEAMIGQYAHGNEPSHHIVYLYAYSETPKIGQKYIHKIINEFHNNTPDGMIGNDDCGQMSAWYILSSLGFYPVNPANGKFVLGAPQVKKATLHLKNNKTFTMEATNFSSENVYQENPKLNNVLLSKPFITYSEIMSGGTLNFQMTNK
ncbi:GH92 family glycosyl hydrolase [Flavobacterium macrobrachii]|uniref:GH92 family glycosyl hydrolase n=1 Tax=Flavobacterium macrobrachii TaxID=591204 RepID=A0ABS2CU93_9FLAO|nr:GH92 family glycosyl hydrolase [Flavobacterium macrobrachii]MBM6498461.1 GH92 family glycosyl hydrolase [Flavobacterium macrobrachii]